MRLMVGISCYDDMKVNTALSLVSALKSMSCEMYVTAQQGPYVHWNREAIIKDAFTAECSHLMFVDTDMVFPHDAITKLVMLDKDIAGGYYNQKVLPPISAIKTMDEFGLQTAVPAEDIPRHPFKCYSVATGFMLINLNSLSTKAQLEPPYFYCEGGEGEDVYFCRRAREAGLEVWCDPTIPLQHIGSFNF